jgi:LysR family transcriptional regulator, chromosome initiation inhibitor
MKRYFADGVTAESMSQAPVLTFKNNTMQGDWLAAKFRSNSAPPTHSLPSPHGFVDDCILGIGQSLNPIDLVAAHIAAGRRVELIPGATTDIPLYWQVSRLAQTQFRS